MKTFSTLQDFEKWYNKQSLFNQYQLMRKHGFPITERNHEELKKAAAKKAGLRPSATVTEILFAFLGTNEVSEKKQDCKCESKPVTVSKEKCYAHFMKIIDVHTDTSRFQNRVDSFSKVSALEVAENYDANKFDPIVVWFDEKKNKTFVLSGHSRLEGMKLRNAVEIPVRVFRGTEPQAIEYAKIDANRSANVESLVEDLKAYRLLRDGDEAKGIKAVSKTALNQKFKGKSNKLEAYSYLSDKGFFINVLSQNNTSEFPHIENRALWVGQLKKEYPQLTQTHEDSAYNFFYGERKHLKLSREEFMKIAVERVAWGKDTLFPECDRDGCVPLKDLSERGPQAESYKRLSTLHNFIETIKDRLSASNPAFKAHTEVEKQTLKELAEKFKSEMKQIKKDLNIVESEAELFGMEYQIPEWSGKDFLINGIPVDLQVIEKKNLPQIKLSYKSKLIKEEKLKDSKDISDLLRLIWEPGTISLRESFVVVYVNNSMKAIGYQIASTGGTRGTVADLKIILGPALLIPCTGIVIAHNHPSGVLKPSDLDKKLTQNVKEGCKIFDITLLDHIILTETGHYSFYNNGLI